MSIPNTPPMGARGTFQLTSPFDVLAPAEVIYTVAAIRSFADIIDAGIDPLTEYYEVTSPAINLTSTQYQSDQTAGACIITLISDSEDPATLFGGQHIIYVPDTYIEAFPNMSNVKYSRIVLGGDLGPLPDYLDLTFLKGQIANVISDLVGVTITVQEFRAPASGAITPTESQVLEAARLANVQLRQTDYARAQALQAQNTLLQATITTLTTALKNASLWPPPQTPAP